MIPRALGMREREGAQSCARQRGVRRQNRPSWRARLILSAVADRFRSIATTAAAAPITTPVLFLTASTLRRARRFYWVAGLIASRVPALTMESCVLSVAADAVEWSSAGRKDATAGSLGKGRPAGGFEEAMEARPCEWIRRILRLDTVRSTWLLRRDLTRLTRRLFHRTEARQQRLQPAGLDA
jgi:hypothetical protein